MKNFIIPGCCLLLVTWSIQLKAQESNDPKTLVREGITLNDSGKYDEAIAKYSLALKIDSTYQNGYYEMAYTLFSSRREKEAIPFLNKLVELNPKSAQGFDMLGSIYDDDKQPDKAIDFFKQAINADSTYQRAYFNIGLTYSRQGMFVQSEQCAVNAIRLEPKHASSQMLYAVDTYKEKKRGCSLLAFCSFLTLEPMSRRSAGAFAYVKNIVNYGITRPDGKNVNVTVAPTSTGSLLMPMAVINAVSGKKGLSAIDSLQLQLTELFKDSKEIVDENETHYVSSHLAAYFELLGGSGNMEAFTRFISFCAYPDENKKWFNDNKDKLTALNTWLKNNGYAF